jgi:2-phospho-L-lactate guanylyltransferase (CobY/MobA/RfbA family)
VGTTTLTWTFSAITNATLSTSLAGSGPNAIKDSSGNGLAGGAGFSQAFSVLYGDFNGDGSVTAADLLGVTAATKQSYNLFADINGDGLVTTADANIVKAQEGATQH